MPFAGFKDFDACVIAQTKDGKDEESARKICGKLQADAENEDKDISVNSMEHLTFNISGRVRREELQGKQYLVVPMTLIVPGVLNGSMGPLFYSRNEINKDPQIWNGVPIVVNHPIDNASKNHIGARDPDVLNRVGIGQIFRAEGGDKLKAEGWFDIEATRKVAPEILANVQAGKRIELSTGLFTDNIKAEPEATFNGVPYDAIATNFRPDHLAILPDSVGASSLADGAGVNVNSQYGGGQMPLTKDRRTEITVDLTTNCEAWKADGDNDILDTFSDKKLTALHNQHTTLISNTEPTEPTEEPVEDKPIENKGKAKNAQDEDGDVVTEKDMEGIDNKGDEAKNNLHGASDEELVAEIGRRKKKNKKTTKNSSNEEPDMATNTEAPKPLTNEEWLASAPEDIRSVVQNSLNWDADQKADLIKGIIENSKNPYTEDELKGMRLDDVRKVAALAIEEPAQPVANYAGAGQVANARSADDSPPEEVYYQPSIYDQKAS